VKIVANKTIIPKDPKKMKIQSDDFSKIWYSKNTIGVKISALLSFMLTLSIESIK